MRKAYLYTAAAMAAVLAATCGVAEAKKRKAPKQPPAVEASQKVAQPSALGALAAAVNIPHEQFTLANGLRVIVHTDRKAPIVAVSVWYGVGSGNEPAGKTGFAHLFEHLMFNGSAGWDSEFFTPLEEVGATDLNGTTWFDRTNYFQNVPTQALDLALFLESDRMGNLLPAVTQSKLDNQRGVVQNEKRQGDSQPYGLVEYSQLKNLFPAGHPYHHSTIGSMADLDAASLETVKDWFRQYYGPNNAVLVLAGDIDAATARPLVEKYFGAIPRGPEVKRPAAPAPQRAGATRETLKDKVGNAQWTLAWLAPSQLQQSSADLGLAAAILGDGAGSRLYARLVREAQVATGVNAFVLPFQLSSLAQITVDVKPGQDPAAVEAMVDEVIAKFLAEGPTEEEVRRVATKTVAASVRGFEQIGGFGGKAVALAEGALYANDANFYKTQLGWYAAATPQSVQAAAKSWLAGGSHRVLVVPGERGEAEKALEGAAITREPPKPEPQAAPDRSKLPKAEIRTALDFPAVERATLSNGVQVSLARRTGVPVVEISALFDAGAAADSRVKPGLQQLTLATMREGTQTRTGQQIAQEIEQLGMTLGTFSDNDSTVVSISALKPNLGASLALMSDVLRNPKFDPADLERRRSIQLSAIAQEEASPTGLLVRALRPLVYGADHPYGLVSGTGTREGLAAVNREDMIAFKDAWLRPDNLNLFVVGDASMAEILPQLEKALGDWKASPAAAKGVKKAGKPAPSGQGRVLLLNRPGPSSVIAAATPLPVQGADDPIELTIANETLGGAFTSRLNIDLREVKGWSYGAGSQLLTGKQDLAYLAFALVQADRTADSVKAMQADITEFLGKKPITAEELQRGVKNNTLSLPGAFETNGAVLAAMRENFVYGRPDTYQETLGARFQAMTPQTVTAAAKAAIDPAKLIWIIAGDAALVEPQLKKLKIPYTLGQP